ncbi:SEC-C domain-containing protein [Halosquirtibacter laminarini]|uniref:SEC-C domain-containing protein n=1 Tax=Halosquirtibacter laminarini TaxID=3374600 RepID=A0AC61NG09_9BACT|nr:SEC-C domain-containing protein [Prolixibacteraceae bacterium]
MDKKSAFEILDSQRYGIPYEAIQFLCEMELNNEIESVIIERIKKAYNEDVILGNSDTQTYHAALWYAIVAEKHLTMELVEWIAKLFSTEAIPDWDMLNEQLLFLVGAACEKYPEAVDLFLDSIAKAVKLDDPKPPYMYLYESVFFITTESQKEKVKELLKCNIDRKSLFSVMLAEKGYDWAKDLIQDLANKHGENHKQGSEAFHTAEEYRYALSLFEKSGRPQCFYLMRTDWQTHYKGLEAMFDEQEAPTLMDLANVGRNDPCPCGSGKKYKKCCLRN